MKKKKKYDQIGTCYYNQIKLILTVNSYVKNKRKL